MVHHCKQNVAMIIYYYYCYLLNIIIDLYPNKVTNDFDKLLIND